MSQKFGWALLSITVYDDRIEVEGSRLLCPKKEIIPYNHITYMGSTKYTRRLQIDTIDGKKHKYIVGGFSQLKACQKAIAKAQFSFLKIDRFLEQFPGIGESISRLFMGEQK